MAVGCPFTAALSTFPERSGVAPLVPGIPTPRAARPITRRDDSVNGTAMVRESPFFTSRNRCHHEVERSAAFLDDKCRPELGRPGREKDNGHFGSPTVRDFYPSHRTLAQHT